MKCELFMFMTIFNPTYSQVLNSQQLVLELHEFLVWVFLIFFYNNNIDCTLS